MAAAARRRARRLVTWPLALALLAALYYAVGGHFAQRIDADSNFAAGVDVSAGGARTAAVLAALVEREVDAHGWVANDPWFFPSAILDDMASFQTAVVATITRRLEELGGLVGDGGPSADLETARDALAAPADRWTFDLAGGLAPQRTSEQVYREGVTALRRFDAAVASGAVTLDRSAAALAAIAATFAAELDAAAAANLRHVGERGGHWLDRAVDDRFMTTRGLAYAQLVAFDGLMADFAEALATAGAAREALGVRRALGAAAALGPWLVMNGPADGQWRASHLAAQASYVLTAGAALRSFRARLVTGA